jgi:O-methyltransferase
MKYSMIQHPELSDYFHAFNSENIQYYDSLKNYLLKTTNIKGSILEFGIGRARSVITTCHLINEYKIKKKFIAFDSFEGFGNISSNDKSYRNAKIGDWSSSPKKQFKYTKENMKKIVSYHIHKKNFQSVKFIKGFVENTLPKEIKKINSISFINLDLDLYSGHKTVLENTWEKLSKNGLIYFDDVFPALKSAPFPGAAIAVNEFFKNKKIKRFICNLRKNLIIQKI